LKNDRQYNGQNEKRQTIQWSKWKTTDNTMVKMKNDRQMVKMKHDRQYNGQNEKGQTPYNDMH
jgi:hypothetical protein